MRETENNCPVICFHNSITSGNLNSLILMYDTAKQIVRSAIYESRPEITDAEMKREIFLRFYGHEFSPADREKFVAALMPE